MLYYSRGSTRDNLGVAELEAAVAEALDKLGERRRVLIVPPDFTRFHSKAGLLTQMAWKYYGERVTDIMPSIGTHYPMTDEELEIMYAGIPKALFRVHDWRNGCTTLGTVPASFVREVSEGSVDYDIPIQTDTLLSNRGHDLILSIGQVVPHEVIGMANHVKNVFVGTGGPEGISKTHFLGAAYGMERIMGRAASPVRSVLNYGAEHFASDLPIVYILTVVGRGTNGKLVVRGLFIGDDQECFHRAADLSLKVNVQLLDEPLSKVVVYLNPSEYRSTWLGNKSIYRTRMAIRTGGELLILAPGLAHFGEDAGIDALIRRYGYVGTPATLDLVRNQTDLQGNLGAAAHLIHGSSDGRFTVTYCPGKLTRAEIESVHFRYGSLGEQLERYNPATLKDGVNRMPDGEEIFYISNPALGLWAEKGRFDGTENV